MRNCLLLLLCLLSLQAAGQTIRGTVTDGETGKPLAAVTVVNMITQQSAYTQADGSYSLSAKKGEAIVFTYVGYKNIQRDAPAAFGDAGELNVLMYRQNYTLEEYILRPKYTPYQWDSIQRKSTYARALARQKSSPMSPVSFLAERLSKRSKRMFRFQKNFYQWEDQKFIDTRYTQELVAQMTKLQGDSIAHFMNANPMPYDFARSASELEIKMWIREQYKLWKKQ